MSRFPVFRPGERSLEHLPLPVCRESANRLILPQLTMRMWKLKSLQAPNCCNPNTQFALFREGVLWMRIDITESFGFILRYGIESCHHEIRRGRVTVHQSYGITGTTPCSRSDARTGPITLANWWKPVIPCDRFKLGDYRGICRD